MRGWLLKPVPLFDNYQKKQNCHIKMQELLSYNMHVRIIKKKKFQETILSKGGG